MDDFSHSQISIVKIDLEGFEIEVLQGMKYIKTFKSNCSYK